MSAANLSGIAPPNTGNDLRARAFWVEAPGRGAIREELLAAPLPAEVLVRTLYTAVSRGTEALVFTGAVPPGEASRMRAPFQAGDFPAPVKYGYINVGRVEDGHEALRGRTVFTLFPHQTRFVVPVDAVTPVPVNVPAARAVLAANLETAINGLWDASPRVGDRIAVIGAGAVGCLVAWLAGQIPGCEVQLIDTDGDRAQLAAALGVPFAVPAQATGGADLVIHASGSAAGLAQAIELAAFEATVLEMSWFGSKPVAVPLGGAFHSQRLSLRSSQVGAVATAQRPRWSFGRRLALALSLLQDARLDALITGESEFSELPLLMPRLASGSVAAVCHRIRYPVD